jgi:hypothetical protein
MDHPYGCTIDGEENESREEVDQASCCHFFSKGKVSIFRVSLNTERHLFFDTTIMYGSLKQASIWATNNPELPAIPFLVLMERDTDSRKVWLFLEELSTTAPIIIADLAKKTRGRWKQRIHGVRRHHRVGWHCLPLIILSTISIFLRIQH